MQTWLAPVAVVAICFVGCGSPAPEPKAAEAPAAAPARAPEPTKSVESRADELIAELQKRQATHDQVQKKVEGNVPVVVEVSPTGARSAPASGGVVSSTSFASSAASAARANDATFWRQEFSIASARLQASQQRMEEARRRMTDAQSQMNSPNEQIRRMGQESHTRAQTEFSAAQSQYYDDSSAVERARSAALAAGVPPSELR